MFNLCSFLALLCLVVSMSSLNASVAQNEDPLRPPEFKIKPSSVNQTSSEKEKVKAAPSWLVREILYSGTRRVAIVNNVAVSKGDKVSGARVIDIKPDHVVLKYKDKTFKTRLRSVSVKKNVVTNQ